MSPSCAEGDHSAGARLTPWRTPSRDTDKTSAQAQPFVSARSDPSAIIAGILDDLWTYSRCCMARSLLSGIRTCEIGHRPDGGS